MIFAFGMRLLLAFGIGDKLAKRFAWLPPLIFAGLAIWAVMSIASNWFEQALDTARESGQAEAVAAGHEQTLDQLGDANNAEADLRTSGERSAARYSECLLDSRDKQACERFNPAAD